MNMPWSAAAALAAYLVGSLSFAVIVSRAMGLADPRSYGSKNPGATNVLRSGNRWAAVVTLALDALKGYVPVLLAFIGAEDHQWWGTGTVALCGLAAFLGHLWPVFFKFQGGKGVATAAGVLFGERVGLGDNSAAFVGLAAFLGHLWPVFFRFRGGKGVATAAGVLLAFNPALGGLVLMTWMVVAYLSRYSSLAAIVAALCAPLYQLLLWDGGTPTIPIAAMSLLLLWRHAGNMQKLIAGTESRLGQKAGGSAQPAGHRPPHPPAHSKKGAK